MQAIATEEPIFYACPLVSPSSDSYRRTHILCPSLGVPFPWCPLPLVSPSSRETMFPNDAEEVMQLIRQLCHAERSIKAQHIRRKQHPLYTAALKYFGSWFAALEAAGINSTQVNPRYGWDRDKIIEAILLQAVERRTLGATYVRPLSLKTAAVKELGSWERALREAGLDPAEYIGQPLTECRQDCKHRKWDRQLATGHQRNSTTRNARQGTRSRFGLP
jgi:hypothetical protein